ncbi:hypothetical protein PMAYCL1PPCAC_13167 [Pristionchus mayeri]|uniref:Uncharacterized protein n=1 Tax=Pristionchus mayeri TaxID=1317129 RepID=A0AAN4ZR82_9BILA|nr:hypothetical protein PMAYCL1PPCAC_13167 [Pristionchus mayeri]
MFIDRFIPLQSESSFEGSFRGFLRRLHSHSEGDDDFLPPSIPPHSIPRRLPQDIQAARLVPLHECIPARRFHRFRYLRSVGARPNLESDEARQSIFQLSHERRPGDASAIRAATGRQHSAAATSR